MSLTLDTEALDRLFPARIDVDASDRIVRLGPSLRRLLGSDPLGKALAAVVEISRPWRAECVEDLIGARQVLLLVRGRTKMRLQGVAIAGGELRHLLVSHAPELDLEPGLSLGYEDFSPADGTADAHLAAIMQATFAREARELAVQLEGAKRLAEGVSNAKSLFLSNVTHELRTPLNIIIGYGELLLERSLEDNRVEDEGDLRHLLNASRGLLGLINRVLTFTRLGERDSNGELEFVHIPALLETLVKDFGPNARAHSDAIIIDADIDMPACLTHWAKLDRCLRELISNAVHFTHEGIITLGAGYVHEADGTWLEISVADTGSGIEDASLEALLARISKTGGDTSAASGLGIGMVMIQRIMETLRGQLKLDSTPGVGSTFTLRLPVKAAEPLLALATVA